MRIQGLCIVDMQPYFDTSNKPRLINNVIRLVKYARENFLPIVVLQYDLTDWLWEASDRDKTHAEIVRALEGAEYVIKWKKNDGGGDEAIEGFREMGLELYDESTIMVCGVNAGACVKETCDEMIESTGCKVRLCAAACNGGGYGNYEYGSSRFYDSVYYWTEYSRLKPNVEIARMMNQKRFMVNRKKVALAA